MWSTASVRQLQDDERAFTADRPEAELLHEAERASVLREHVRVQLGMSRRTSPPDDRPGELRAYALPLPAVDDGHRQLRPPGLVSPGVMGEADELVSSAHERAQRVGAWRIDVDQPVEIGAGERRLRRCEPLVATLRREPREAVVTASWSEALSRLRRKQSGGSSNVESMRWRSALAIASRCLCRVTSK
jgi:hypothetical protein